MQIRVTHIGTASVLLEIGSVRILTDPALDPPGRVYKLGFGTSSKKLSGPAMNASMLEGIDAVLLSHDHHADNLDDAGRAFLPRAGKVVTTTSGARRLGGNAVGLAAWDTTEIVSGATRVEVTATPARHGPPGSLPIVGDVVGFMLKWDGQERGPLYISGDTVWFRGIAEVARRFRPSVSLLHLADVGFGITGPVRYTFDAAEAVTAARALGSPTIVPIHYEGWTHFRQGRAEAERVFAREGIEDRVRWLPMGQAIEIDV